MVPQEQNKTLTLPIQVGNDTIYKEFAIVPIEWDVPLDNLTPRSTNTKGNITVTGTIQDVVAALQRTDPTYQLPSDNDDDVLSPLLEPRRNPLLCPNTLRESPFQTRPPGTYTALYRTCGREMPGKWADKKSMYDGIKYLRTVPGQPKNPPGVASCGRVSCSWDTAIYWCNHVSFRLGFSFLLTATNHAYVRTCRRRMRNWCWIRSSLLPRGSANWIVLIVRSWMEWTGLGPRSRASPFMKKDGVPAQYGRDAEGLYSYVDRDRLVTSSVATYEIQKKKRQTQKCKLIQVEEQKDKNNMR